MASRNVDTELAAQGSCQGWRPQGRVLTLAFVQPLPHGRMDGVGVAETTIQERLPAPVASHIAGLPPGQLSGGDVHAQFTAHRLERFAGFDPLQQLRQALRLVNHGWWVIHRLGSYL